MNLEKLALTIVQQANNGVINEKTVMSVSDSNNLSLIEFSKLCDILTEIGISIVDNPTNDFDKNIDNIPDNISIIVSLFNKLTSEDKEKCYVLLGESIKRIKHEDNSSSEIKEDFFKRVINMRLQYSYIAIFLKAFLTSNNNSYSVELQKIIDFYRSYYTDRKNNNLISEQDDSIFAKSSYSDIDIRRIILFNPMKRSFLANYFSFDKKNNSIIIDSDLFNQLSKKEITEIIETCDQKLEEYYNRIS